MYPRSQEATVTFLHRRNNGKNGGLRNDTENAHISFIFGRILHLKHVIDVEFYALSGDLFRFFVRCEIKIIAPYRRALSVVA